MDAMYKEQLNTIACDMKKSHDVEAQMVSAVLFTLIGTTEIEGSALRELFDAAIDISRREITRLQSYGN